MYDALHGKTYDQEPLSREEFLLKQLVEGGGGGGTTDYEELTNKPSINGTTLSGDMSSEELDILDGTITSEEINNLWS